MRVKVKMEEKKRKEIKEETRTEEGGMTGKKIKIGEKSKKAKKEKQEGQKGDRNDRRKERQKQRAKKGIGVRTFERQKKEGRKEFLQRHELKFSLLVFLPSLSIHILTETRVRTDNDGHVT